MKPGPIYVAKPALPRFIEFVFAARSIWNAGILTNNGPHLQRLKDKLQDFLSVNRLTVTSNGTLPLELALQSLNLPPGSEVITTCYSFVATSNAIIRSGFKPVFVDIEDTGFNICPDSVERAINENTGAIIPVHVYGTPANFSKIDLVSKKYSVPIIYDAAHAFGVEVNNKSLLLEGSISTCSFHATKIFNTAEGGCIVQNVDNGFDFNKAINFGFCEETDIDMIGINGKLNEISAALGLLNLKNFERDLSRRKSIFEKYLQCLPEALIPMQILDSHFSPNISWNYAYMPIRFDSVGGEVMRNASYDLLRRSDIFARKYFYPLIQFTSAYRNAPCLWREDHHCANGIAASKHILCLPLHIGMTKKDVARICDVMYEALA